MPQPPFDRTISEGSGDGAGLKIEGTNEKPFGLDFLQDVISVQWGNAGHFLALAIITTVYERYDLYGSPFAIGECCNTTLADWVAIRLTFPSITKDFLPSCPSRRADYPILIRPGVASDLKGPGSGIYKGLYGVTEILTIRREDESIDIYNTRLDLTVKTANDTFTNNPTQDALLGDKKPRLQTGHVSNLPVLKRPLQNTPAGLTPIDFADLPGVSVVPFDLTTTLNSGGGDWYAADQQTGGSVPTTKENIHSWIIQDPYACHIKSIPTFDFTLDHIKQYYGSKIQTRLNFWCPKIIRESWCTGFFNIHHGREECAAPPFPPDLYNGAVVTTVKGLGFDTYAEPTIVTTDRVDWSKVAVQYKNKTYAVIGVNSYFNGLISVLLKAKGSHNPPVVGDVEVIRNHG